MNRYNLARYLISLLYYPVFWFLAKTPKTRLGAFLYKRVLVPLYELRQRVDEAQTMNQHKQPFWEFFAGDYTLNTISMQGGRLTAAILFFISVQPRNYTVLFLAYLALVVSWWAQHRILEACDKALEESEQMREILWLKLENGGKEQ